MLKADTLEGCTSPVELVWTGQEGRDESSPEMTKLYSTAGVFILYWAHSELDPGNLVYMEGDVSLKRATIDVIERPPEWQEDLFSLEEKRRHFTMGFRGAFGRLAEMPSLAIFEVCQEDSLVTTAVIEAGAPQGWKRTFELPFFKTTDVGLAETYVSQEQSVYVRFEKALHLVVDNSAGSLPVAEAVELAQVPELEIA